MAATNDEDRSIPRSILLLRLVWRCAFCVFAVVAGNVVLLAVPQAREALQATLAPAVASRGWSWSYFVLAVLYWAMSAWLVSRLLLSRRFRNDSLGSPRDEHFVHWVSSTMPRVLALMATVPVSLLTLQTNGWLGAGLLVVSLVFIGALVLRTKFGGVTEGHSYGAFHRMGPVTRQATLGLFALGAVLLAGLWNLVLGQVLVVAWPLAALALRAVDARRDWTEAHDTTLAASQRAAAREQRAGIGISLFYAGCMLVLLFSAGDEIDLARRLASPALLLFALGGWTVFGGLLLSYLPMARGGVTLALWVPPLLLLVFGDFQPHQVAQREMPGDDGRAATATWRQQRPTLAERFGPWLAQVPQGDPIYVVAAVGGASRAAYWTGSVLARMEDEARAQQRRFGANILAISGISGGSLGAAAYVAGLAQFPDAASCLRASPALQGQDAAECLSRHVNGFLARDFLAPPLGRMLFPDLALRFVPSPASWAARADRSLGLEDAWAQDWARQFAGVPGLVSWRQPLTGLYRVGESPAAPRLPILLLNTVRLDDGQRFVQAPVKLDVPGLMDLLHAGLDTRRLTLAQAVHNSARFPYVSPAAVLRAAPASAARAGTSGPELGRLGDGGYHEGSGAATLADLLEAMTRQGLLRRVGGAGGLWACKVAWQDTPTRDGACPGGANPLVAIVLDSEPGFYPAHHVRDLQGRPLDATDAVAAGAMPLPEVLAPVFGGLSTRTQLSLLSQRRLSRLVGEAPDAMIELRLPWWRLSVDQARGSQACAGRRAQPSMTWNLDECTTERMRVAAAPQPVFGPAPTLGEAALRSNLERLREHLCRSKPATQATAAAACGGRP